MDSVTVARKAGEALPNDAVMRMTLADTRSRKQQGEEEVRGDQISSSRIVQEKIMMQYDMPVP